MTRLIDAEIVSVGSAASSLLITAGWEEQRNEATTCGEVYFGVSIMTLPSNVVK